eukprot:1232008-Ditylum_brightwellii.AAC.1
MKNVKEVQWRDATIHQNNIVLMVLDPKTDSHKMSELFQWETHVQLSAQGASNDMPITKTGNKVKHQMLKLEETHDKNLFTVQSKKETRIKVATFLNMANDVTAIYESVTHWSFLYEKPKKVIKRA